MVVRIRFAKSRNVLKPRGRSQRLAGAAGALLMLPAVMALVLAFWSIAAGMNWTSGFAIPSGFFSHWQAWLALAVGLQLISRMLNRYGRSG